MQNLATAHNKLQSSDTNMEFQITVPLATIVGRKAASKLEPPECVFRISNIQIHVSQNNVR